MRSVALAALAVGVVAVPVAVSAAAPKTTTTATCTTNPSITPGVNTSSFRVTCSVPNPTAATVTVTQTVTATSTPTLPSATSSNPETAPTTTAPTSATSSPTSLSPSPTSSASSTPPATSAFPTPDTTGVPAGVTLAAYTGPLTISAPGTVIDGKDVRGCLFITASNVTIRNSRIQCASGSPTQGGTMVLQQGTYYAAPTGLTITDTEISRPTGSNGGADYGVLLYGSGVTMTRVLIRNVTSGVHFSGTGATITDSYLGGFVNISGQDHNDAVIANGGATNVVLRHNTLEVPIGQTTPIAMYPEGTPNSYWTIDGNLLNGGGYCMYPSYSKGSEQPNHHITVTGNVFGTKFFPRCGQYGPVNGGPGGARFGDGAGNVWTGNTWQGSGATVLPD